MAFIYTALPLTRHSRNLSAHLPRSRPRIHYRTPQPPISLLSTTDLSDEPPTPNREESDTTLDSATSSNPQPHPSRLSRTRLLILSIILSTSFYLIQSLPLNSIFTSLQSQISQLGIVRASFLLGAINFFTVVLCFPANMGLMIGAGAILGPLPAFTALFLSKLLAASVAFWLARGVLYERARNWLAAYPKLSKLILESGKDGGWKFVLLMRLSPFPGFLLNYMLSITGVSFVEYVFATILGIVPSISNLVLIGATARDVGVGVTGGALRGGWLSVSLKALCVMSMVVVMVVVTRRARRAFAELDE